MLTVFTLALLALTSAAAQLFHRVELAEEKTPYDYVKERLDSLGADVKTGLPLSNSYEVEESVDYPEQIEGAASQVLNTVGGVGGIGYGQGLGIGGIGGLGGVGIGQGLGIGIGGLGGLGGVGGVGNVGGIGVGGLGGGIGGQGIVGQGLIHPGLAGLGVGGVGLGGGLLYHPLIQQSQVGGGYVDKNAYDAAQKKGAGENLEKLEKKSGEEVKHGQEGYQQGAAAAAAAKGESSFYKDEEAKKKAAGDEKYYEGGQKIDKQGWCLISYCSLL